LQVLSPGGYNVKLHFVTGALAIGLLGTVAMAQTAPDNTKVNQRDRSKTSATADQSKNNKTDRDLAQQIRKSIHDDSSLSTYAHNVKIIAQGGRVTLKGPVRSETEKQTIAQKATTIAGAGNVTDEITIKPSSDKK
jgi:hyperosmotically inducible periplasmic protein